MLYPIYVHKEDESAYGAIFPDFPGCFTGVDKLQDLPKAAQEAVKAHFHNDADAIPLPSTPEKWDRHEDYTGGYWMMVDIDLSKTNTKHTRLNTNIYKQVNTETQQAMQELESGNSASFNSIEVDVLTAGAIHKKFRQEIIDAAQPI